MIARVWTAEMTASNAPAYAEHVKTHVFSALRQVRGYAGAMLLQRGRGDAVDVIVLSWWDSLEAIGGFAGADLEKAVVAEEAAALMTRFDRRVRHYEIVADDRPR